MQPSSWDKRYSVAISAVDIQHQSLVHILDGLTMLVIQKKEIGLINPLLDNLFTGVKEHFECEENLMKSHHYPSFTIHKAMHDAFLKQLSKDYSSWKEGKESLSIEGVSLLKRWFIDHILGVDRLLTPFFNQKGLS